MLYLFNYLFKFTAKIEVNTTNNCLSACCLFSAVCAETVYCVEYCSINTTIIEVGNIYN